MINKMSNFDAGLAPRTSLSASLSLARGFDDNSHVITAIMAWLHAADDGKTIEEEEKNNTTPIMQVATSHVVVMKLLVCKHSI